MSRKRIKNPVCCTKCHSNAGLLLVPLPSNVFTRTRTESETDALELKRVSETLTLDDLTVDRKRRRLRLCPKCIKPYQAKNGRFDVQNWKVQP